MSMRKTIGGDRLGSGAGMKVDLRSYESSTHDLGYIWRSTMASGTLVPFMTEVALRGDKFEIDLDSIVMTHPTTGPLFGSYKIQLDVFSCPIRLYQAQLHNNKLGIGNNMANVKLPQMTLWAAPLDWTKPDVDNQQINPSSIFSYLNIRGLGRGAAVGETVEAVRQFNAVPFLSYWDIYKNYYANKQEEVGAVIHNSRLNLTENTLGLQVRDTSNNVVVTIPYGYGSEYLTVTVGGPVPTANILVIGYENTATEANSTKPKDIIIDTREYGEITLQNLAVTWQWLETSKARKGSTPYIFSIGVKSWRYASGADIVEEQPQVEFFPLKNLDDMREDILSKVKVTSAYNIDKTSLAPYGLPFKETNGRYSKMSSQEGLALKTYQSDLFNNWMSTEWIDGDNGINAITAVDTSDGNFTIDTLNLSKKVYDMLNRIAISGGSYNDWQDAVWGESGTTQVESPIYMGGLIKELTFQEVVSNANAETSDGEQPLGSLAGKGVMGKKHKGGKVHIKVSEPSYIMGIISLTPRIDYSQGNKWDTNLKTMDDFHKPALDEIGYQDLVTDQMYFADTVIEPVTKELTFMSAGKQPAWLNYMTNVNQVRGNFAIRDNQMFMILNRQYEFDGVTGGIKDLTTYIDPIKFNDIFAQKARDAQNFWVQVSVDMKVRRKMSAKIMPNL